MAKAVLQVSYYNNRVINEFKSVTEASKELNIPISSISLACKDKGGYKSAGGFRWMFKVK